MSSLTHRWLKNGIIMYYQKWEGQIFSEKLLQFLSLPLTKQLANMVFKYLKYSTYTKGKKKKGD